jgi:hypothetical protein
MAKSISLLDAMEVDMPVLHSIRQATPPCVYDEKAINAALKILMPNPKSEDDDWCRDDIMAAFATVADSDLFFAPRSKQANKALQRLLAALQRAKDAKRNLPWADARSFEIACDIEAGIAFCKREENEQKQMPPLKPRPPSHRQRVAVRMAYYLVCTWLGRGNYRARALSRQSAWYRLSAILFGKKIDLRAHMRDYQKVLSQLEIVDE